MPKRIVVEFAGDTSKLDTAYAKVKSGSSGVEKAIKGVAAGAALGLVTDQMHDAMDAASNLNESLSKSNNVFGASASAIDSWAKRGAQNFGLSRQAALEAASSFGNMFGQLGIGTEQAANMSQNIVQLAADFASFHNADISEVVTAQSAAFRGEYDALQRFLPLINAAAVEQEALALTGKKSKDALTDQDKALAVNSLMFKGAGAAMGDFSRTADGAANQQRTLAAEMENMKAALGEGLLPVFTEVAGFIVDDLIPAIQQLTDTASQQPDEAGFWGRYANTLKDWGKDVIGWAAELPGPILKLGGIFSGSFKNSADAADDLATKMHRSSQEAFLGAHAADAHAAALKVAKGITDEATKATNGKTAATEKSTKALDEETKAVTKKKDADLDARGAALSLEQSTHALAKAQDDYNRFLETGGIDAEKVKAAQEDLIAVQKDVERATLDVAKAQEAVNKALEPMSERDRNKLSRDEASATDDVTEAHLNLTDAQDEQMRVTTTATATAEDRTRALLRVNDAARAVKDAEDRLTDAHTASTEAQKIGTTQSQAYKDAAQVLSEKQAALKTATDAQTLAQGALTTAQALGKDHADKLWQVTQDLASAHLDFDQKTWGAEKAQRALKEATDATTGGVRTAWGNVKGYNEELGKIPKDIKTTVTYEEIYAVPAGTSQTNAQSYAQYLKSVPSNADPVPYDMWAKRHARAAGGPVKAGKPYMVGELGPEMFVPGRSGTVVPNDQMAASTTYIFNLNGVVDNAGAARAIQQILLEEKRRSGPLGLG